ncbi:hypothetical protein [Sporosalibacterium faouarense]|uniref:hypothetical protein n=1 Tax=Sporosalibacterium faouarense TaxID=516123 RepID=UPI00141D4C99|nr:hypothetical protein [Sporosalibacterium faouarense]MTI49597.1 hypothetical protein [Bacillota bacterium]
MTLQNSLNLNKLSKIELENIRHIAGSHQMMQTKLQDYANKCQDSQIKQMFQQGAQSAGITAQNLTNSL